MSTGPTILLILAGVCAGIGIGAVAFYWLIARCIVGGIFR